MSTEANVIEMNLEIPTSPLASAGLPCGYIDSEGTLHSEVEVRELTGVEEDILATKGISFSDKITNVLARCVLKIGTISDPSSIAAIIPKLLVGDRLFLLFAIRQVTLGDEYPFTYKCESCDTEQTFVVRLSDFEVFPMEDPFKRVFDAKLPSGKTARFRSLTGEDEREMAKAGKRREDVLSYGIFRRLELLDGKPPSLAAVKALSLRDRNYLREAFDQNEGGIETTMEIDCPNCGAEAEKEIGIQSGFFFPSESRKRSKRRSSS